MNPLSYNVPHLYTGYHYFPVVGNKQEIRPYGPKKSPVSGHRSASISVW